MPDKTSRAIKRLLSRPGLRNVCFYRHGSDFHVQGASNIEGVVPQGVTISDRGESQLTDALECLDNYPWDGGEPPDQLAEADARAAEAVDTEGFHTGLIRDREKAEKETDAYLERAIAAERRVEVLEDLVKALEAAHGHGPSSEVPVKPEREPDGPSEVRPMVWVGSGADCTTFWRWEHGDWGRTPGKSWDIVSGIVFVPGHHPRPTINPAEMGTIETCKEIWDAKQTTTEPA